MGQFLIMRSKKSMVKRKKREVKMMAMGKSSDRLILVDKAGGAKGGGR